MATPRQIVPPVDFVARGLAPIAGAPTARLTNHGGKVIGSVEVVPIYWGAAWASGVNAQLASQLDGYFDYITTSSLIDMLSEYSLPATPIARGKRLTSLSVPGSEPGTVTPNGRQVTDAQIQQAIQGWIGDHTLPANTDNTLYFVYLPPNVSCVGPGGTGASCSQFCGYHGAFGGNIYYAVIPYVNCNGCVFPGNFLDTLTEVSSHELCEAITDPALSTWWDQNTGDEIGDICNRQTATLGGYVVQTEWSNAQNACVIAPLSVLARRVVDGYATTFNNQQHVNFVGADNHVHELYYANNNWHLNDLTQVAGAPDAAAASAIDGYQTSYNNQQHVNFVGPDGHVHELYYDGAWHHNDLTQLAGAPPAALGNVLDSYETAFNNQQHVNFVGADNHVHELYYDGAWRHNDLTQITGAPAVAAGGRTDGYVTTSNRQQQVNFVGTDNHVHELYYDGAWRHNDLTQITGAPAAAAGSAIDGYQTAFNNQQHVNFVGADNHVHELYYDGAWHHNDLTQITRAPAVAAGGAIDGYVTTFNSQQHVNFVGADNHVHELYYDGAWHHNDLNSAIVVA